MALGSGNTYKGVVYINGPSLMRLGSYVIFLHDFRVRLIPLKLMRTQRAATVLFSFALRNGSRASLAILASERRCRFGIIC